MRKIIIAVLVVFFAGIGVWNLGEKKVKVLENGKPVVKIGVIAPLTGDNAEVSQNVRDVLISYAAERSKSSNIEYKLVIEDDGFKTRNIAPILSKLNNIDEITGVISIFAYVGMTTTPIAKNIGLPHINVGSNPDVADNEYSFLNYTPPKMAAIKLIELIEKDGYKNFAIAHMDHVGPAPYAKETKNLAKSRGIEYFDYTFNPTEKDFRMILANIKEKNPDVLVLLALPPSIDIFRKQMIDAGVNIPITSINFISTSNNKHLFEGVSYVESPDGEENFVKRVKKELKIDNMFLLAFSQDSLEIFIDIIESFYKANGEMPSKKEIVKQIKNLNNFQGAAGTYSMGKDGVTQSKAVIKKVVDAKPVIVE